MISGFYGIDWMLMTVAAPLLGAMLGFAAPRLGKPVGLAAVAASGVGVVMTARQMLAQGPLRLELGGWGAPLGIDLFADGLSIVLLGMAGVVALGVAAAMALGLGKPDAHETRYFWPLFLILLAGLNGVFLSTDLFNLYVMLEVITAAAVGLAVLSGKPAALRAGLEYMLASLLGALIFLLGVALLYLTYGRLDMQGLAAVIGPDLGTTLALVLIMAGLALKAALFPLHFWLPAAHANAPAPVSALLSGLVLKAGLFIAVRVWTQLFAPTDGLAMMIGTMGALAIFWGSVQALRAERLKLLVAYSTVAQVGLIVLAFGVSARVSATTAWSGAVVLMLAHGIAKAAMFLAAGRIKDEIGHDRIADLDRSAIRPTLAQFSFGLAAISLIGLPPTLGFAGKWMLLEGAIRADAWVWVAVVLTGTLLSVGYLSRVMVSFLRFDRVRGELGEHQGWRLADAPPLVLAIGAFGLGLFATQITGLLAIGNPFNYPDLAPAVSTGGVEQ